MGRALAISILFHALLFGAVLWSGKIAFELFKKNYERNRLMSGSIQVNLYKPTDSPLDKGQDKKDLPPPLVGRKAEEKDTPELKVKAKTQEKKEDKSKPAASKKPNLKSILDRIRSMVNKDDDRPLPKQNNFPKSPEGQKGARGTGSRAGRPLSPAEQALQSAMRRYFEMEGATTFRTRNPNARGFMTIQLIASDRQLRLASFKMVEPSGFSLLDRSCELAVRKALDTEHFASDVISELNGKETTIVCEP